MKTMENSNNKKTASAYIKENLFSALLELMKEKDFSDIRIQDIAKRAGVSRVSYYRNFTSKEDVLESYMNEETGKFHQEHSGEDGREFLIHLLEHLKKYKDKFELLYKNNLSHLFLHHIYQWCGPKEGTNDHEAYLKAAKAFAIYGFIDEWVKRGMKGKTEAVADEIIKALHSTSYTIVENREQF